MTEESKKEAPEQAQQTEIDLSDYNKLKDRASEAMEMTATEEWKRMYNFMVVKIKEAKNDMLDATGKNVVELQQKVKAYKQIIELEVNHVDALNSFLKKNPIMIPQEGPIYGGEFDFESGIVTVKSVSKSGIKKLNAAHEFPIY